MQLLDAALAFALTLAALATVVTVIMESCIRIARVRKKNFMLTMSLLTGELKGLNLNLDEEQIWDFLVRVIKSPAEADVENIKAKCRKIDGVENRMAFLGPDSRAGLGRLKRILNFICQITGDPKRAPLNDGASLEYLLRCLAEAPGVKERLGEGRREITLAFNRIARKYEEISASVSANFKRNAQAWSMGIGIVFALVCNVNGLVIFDSFVMDPELAEKVIATQKSIEALDQSDAPLTELTELKLMGIPLGWESCPVWVCLKKGKIDTWEKRRIWLYEAVVWCVQVGLTGILIGLGAPFWFDVAKRLSHIRKGVQSEAASKEFRFTQGNANGDARQRRRIVGRVLADAVREAKHLPQEAEPG